MDPIAAIQEMRQLANRIVMAQDRGEAPDVDDAYALAERFIALDGWRRKQGFDPWEAERG